MAKEQLHAGPAPTREGLERTNQDVFEFIATETLEFFDRVARAASERLGLRRRSDSTVLAQPNDFTAHRALRQLAGIQAEHGFNLLKLREEPAIARVVARDEVGEVQTYFISRATPVLVEGNARAASYRAPLGRLASLPVGSEEEFSLPKGKRYFEILERASLRPRVTAEGWDSIDSLLHGHNYGPVTIASFARLLQSSTDADTLDPLEALLASDARDAMIIEGRRRSIIDKMGLRDQPILDQFQDEIFRLPVDTRLVVLGPPGSGKTTTLIKRLGLTLDLENTMEYLEDEDRQLIESTLAGKEGHSQSWMMFTPTELLKQYVKEAFAREGIAASDLRIQTWSDCRRELARGKLQVLRTSIGGGPFLLNDQLASLDADIFTNQISWFDDFAKWQLADFWRDLEQQATQLVEDRAPEIRSAGQRIVGILTRPATQKSASTLGIIIEATNALQDSIARMRKESEAAIRKSLSAFVRNEPRLLDELLEYVRELKNEEEALEDAEGDETDDDEPARTRVGRELAFDAYVGAVRALARATLAERKLGPASRDGIIVSWLQGRVPSQDELKAIGQSLRTERAARWLLNSARRYVIGIPRRYRQFRRERQQDSKWYMKGGIGGRDINSLELDLILLAMLKAARELLVTPRFEQDLENPRNRFLGALRELYKTQMVVDEATDFSPIQLACMASLCDPAANSFFACGDFNQRITRWGARTADDLRWVYDDIQVRRISVTYRHSRQLNEFARSIATILAPDAEEAELPKNTNNDGVKPVLGRLLSTPAATAAWLALRIIEIEKLTPPLPSVAVLVIGENEVRPLADALDLVLRKHSLHAVACPGGQVVGQDMDIRVFDIQHIKGLEFEAVFLVDLDELATREPDIFEKYLYVGATRAATYLGITVRGDALPAKVGQLEPLFDGQWSS